MNFSIIAKIAENVMTKKSVIQALKQLSIALCLVLNIEEQKRALVSYGLNELTIALNYCAEQRFLLGSKVFSVQEAEHLKVIAGIELYEKINGSLFGNNERKTYKDNMNRRFIAPKRLSHSAELERSFIFLQEAPETNSLFISEQRALNSRRSSFVGIHETTNSYLNFHSKAVQFMKRALEMPEQRKQRELLKRLETPELNIFSSDYNWNEYRKQREQALVKYIQENEKYRRLNSEKLNKERLEREQRLELNAGQKSALLSWYNELNRALELRSNELKHDTIVQARNAYKQALKDKQYSEQYKYFLVNSSSHFRNIHSGALDVNNAGRFERWIKNGRSTIAGYRALNNGYIDHVTGIVHCPLRKGKGKDISLNFDEYQSETAPLFHNAIYSEVINKEIVTIPKTKALKFWDENAKEFVHAERCSLNKPIRFKTDVKVTYELLTENEKMFIQQYDVFTLYGNVHIRAYRKQEAELSSDNGLYSPVQFKAPKTPIKAPELLNRNSAGRFVSKKKMPKKSAELTA